MALAGPAAADREGPDHDAQTLGFMIHHIFLPPRLPRGDDTNAQHVYAMVHELRDSISEFRRLADCSSLQPAFQVLERFIKTIPGPGRDELDKAQALRSIIADLKNGDTALFHLQAQNAGLLLTARQDDILFEAFELLAPNQNVMSCKGALLREFPDRAAVVSFDKIRDGDFLSEFADVIQKLGSNIAAIARPKVCKAGTVQPEERDTLSPFLATGMLIDVLVGLGQEAEPKRITKRSREHAGWSNAFLSFHRSPAWLLLRVALRLVLDREAAIRGEGSWYKPLMAFHHARILSLAARAKEPSTHSDMLFSMTAKLVRRISKLNPAEETHWLERVRTTVMQSQAVLKKRWAVAQGADTNRLPLYRLSKLSFEKDSELKLQTLRQHLSWIESRSTGHRDAMGPGDATHFNSLPHFELPPLSSRASADATMNRSQLLKFEAWVEFALPRWLEDQLGLDLIDINNAATETAVSGLQDLISAYHERALKAYEGVPGALSVMCLVMMELWTAMDRLAGAATPLLLDYDPGIPPDLFHPLLLERKEEMRRLNDLESYLLRRRAKARGPYSSAFGGFGSSSSFAVQFYGTSPTHQNLRERIENWAFAKRAEKLREYEEKRAEHHSLAANHSTLSCEMYWSSQWRNYVHTSSCTRCRLGSKMRSLTIDVFEWPLPEDPNDARAAVVEICIPPLVKIWRNITWKLVTKVFRDREGRHQSSGETLYFAGAHSGLQYFLVPNTCSRLRPASTVKPMEVSHYRVKHILEATPENICVPHAAQYSYHDEPSELFAEEQVLGVCIPRDCSYAELAKGLPAESWIRYSKHTSNDVIANQFCCPPDTTLEEFRAFGNLRAGITLQWANVLCQLRIPSVNFNKNQTFALIMQTCLEAGSPSKADPIHRKAHIDTQNVSFMNCILRAMGDALERIHESWQNDIALGLLACLATRLLSLSSSSDISNALLEYLAKLRKTSIAWARLLLDKLNHSDVDQERQEWAQRLVMAALICTTTFNIGEKHLGSVLNDTEELACFVESAVLARNHLPPSGRPSDPIALQLVDRWCAAMYQARNVATTEVVDRANVGLDKAIKQFWTGYSPPTTKWAQCDLPCQGHILERGDNLLSITFNILTGSLFVNGYPLSKLPLAYQQHKTFHELFGEQILDVGPSSVPEMQFSACRDQNGWVIHFAMKDDRLVVRAVRQRLESDGDAHDDPRSETWEYIPRSELGKDLPSSFVDDYAHWLDLSTHEVEFRPIDRKWVTSSGNWRLSHVSGKYMLKRGSCSVIDPSSPTADLVGHRILGRFESFRNIDPIFDRDKNILHLQLPRLSLSFRVHEGETIIKSKNYAGMQIDEDQAVGTLIGISHRLVLKPDGGPGCRKVLIPRGQVSAQSISELNHVEVCIRPSGGRHIRHDAFAVDSTLGCLTDTGSLQSKLYLCWLHALTSHCLPDPLTLRTGTEEALRILGGAAVRSYPNIDQDSRKLLGQIAKLSPRREYYPQHLQVMERATWSDGIPPLSQHDDFWPLAKSVYEGYETFAKLFQLRGSEECTMFETKVFKESGMRRSFDLEERARIRNAIFRVSEFGAEGHTTAEDNWYHPGDRVTTGPVKKRAMVAQLTRCVDTGGECLIFSPSSELPQIITSANGSEFSGRPEVDLAFSVEYLQPPRLSLNERWCGLHRALVGEKNRYRKIFFLACLLYAEQSDHNIVQALMALGSISVFSRTEMLPPSEPTFNLTVNRDTLPKILIDIVESGVKNLDESPESNLGRRPGETTPEFEIRQHRRWLYNSQSMVSKFVCALETKIQSSWTVETPNDQSYSWYLDFDLIMPKVRAQIETARASEAFQMYLASLSKEMGRIDLMENCNLRLPPRTGGTVQPSRPGFITAGFLFSQPAPSPNHPHLELIPILPCLEPQGSESKHERLRVLVEELKRVERLHGHQVSYLDELCCSMDSPAARQRLISLPKNDPKIQPTLIQHLQDARKGYDAIRFHLELALSGTSLAHRICDDAGLCPRISPIFFLQRLTRTLWAQLSTEWKRCLIKLALGLIYLQRAERLASYSLNISERWGDLQKELSNPGDHDSPDWDPLEYPESLLLEIEQGIMIRPVQNRIAADMRSPPEMKNSVMQLNMGEGKSSVIVPIVAAALANGSRLVRVVVAKPQSSQMTHMLISKLGGLINRRVFYLPLSRSIQLSECDVHNVRKLIETCESDGGVLLVQPEHLLSFKLMGIDKSWVGENTEKSTLGKDITRLYQDFESCSRDIVDESDENFSVKFELVYTMGAQEAVEMSPDRWILVQELLKKIEAVVRGLMATKNPVTEVSRGILFEDHGVGRVPVIRILGESAGRQLIRTLAAEVCRLGLRGFPVHHQTERMRQAVLNYILLESATEDDIAMVESIDGGFFNDLSTKHALLLLRGLIAKGVILFALSQKRFRVNYGLTQDRQPPTMLAVPYRAKDMPSPRSEFSHPDVVIVLTCLSYYYRGLSDTELYMCFELLYKSDQAEEEYGRWVTVSPHIRPSFRHFSSINIKDRPQCETIVFPALRYARPAIDFFLASIVFPREMKQFPLKLSASGWDLAKTKTHPLTGFSGTNDSKGVLPLSIMVLDSQPQTNAAVLSTLLQEENQVLELGDWNETQLSALTEEMLLGALADSEPPMQVIIDVGAQVIESSNPQMARKLLDSISATTADAVIFFDDHNELCVLTRNGIVDSFLTSPFAAHTDRCLVFLDQAHTRGTDLKLPGNYRAAVTLGPGVTKDTLVQACMRMRKLGQGQSVSFIASPEMQKRIRSTRNITDGRSLTVLDVLAWAISETWDEAVRSVPLWATQGLRHLRQEKIWQQADESGSFSSANAREYLEPEAMSLEQRYQPKPPTAPGTELADLMSNLSLDNSQQPQLAAIQEKLLTFAHSASVAPSSALQEEQERELAPEFEEERQLSRPPPRKALQHILNPDLTKFIRTGHIPTNSPAFLRPFTAFSTTNAASLFSSGLSSFPSDLLITRDFARTVDETGPGFRSDSYQRGVQWVLTASTTTTITGSGSGAHAETAGAGQKAAGMVMVVVSQWEANQIKDMLLKQQKKRERKGWVRGVIKDGEEEKGDKEEKEEKEERKKKEEKRKEKQLELESKPVVTLHAYLPRPSLTFQSMEDLKTYTVPAVAAEWEAPRELVMQLNLFAGQLYLRSYDEYVRLCRHLGLAYTENKGEEAVAPDGFVGKKGYPECEFDSSPVAFLAEVYKKIRRDCVGIEKTHMGKVLAGEILTERDF